MPRARGANAIMALAFNTGPYGGVPGAGAFAKLPFVTSDLGEEQGLIESDLLGYGRDPQEPGDDVVNDEGNVVVPVDLRAFGFWLKLLFGAPTTVQGVAATGSITFSAQPANNSNVGFNTVGVVFVTGTPAAGQVKIGADLAETVSNLVAFLNASTNPNLTVATYSADLEMNKVLITHKTIGTAGNSYQLTVGTTPSPNAVASGATLTGGAATGPYNHEFVAGALALPDAAIEIGHPDVPSYAMNYGVMADTLAIQMQRSGHLNATLGLIAQGERPRTTTSAAGALSELVIKRFSQFSGQIKRDGIPLASISSGSLNIANGLDKDESIRQDGRIGGADPGGLRVGGQIVSRFRDHSLLDLAASKTGVELEFGWRISASESLLFRVHRARLPKVKLPVSGPGGIQATIPFQGAERPGLNRTLTAVLVNDVANYN